ncbi:hypothetical protein [Halosegnis sp.]|uniref:hypothetical protein n=1 Tax=Halosegnis sp. TaxID=2864959 RepID=UPI0035D414BB
MTDELADIDHTNPHTDAPFGETQTYARGRTVAADGGAQPDEPTGDGDSDAATEPEADVSTDGGDAEPDTLADIDHTPRRGAPSANAAYDAADGANR